jgi:CDP-diacylglycerol---serine O-phosphatidyltransferase
MNEPNSPPAVAPAAAPAAVEKPLSESDKELLAENDLEQRRRQMIKFLPNSITTSAMFFGFIATMMAVEGKFYYAAWAVVAAGVCDMLDGRVARLTKSTSPFGAEYDSLSDLIAFGVAPAMIAYFWALRDSFGRLAWAAAFLYVACAAIRLAKFNTLTGEEESRRYFRGIPSPGAAGLVIVMVLMHMEYFPEYYRKGGVFTGEGGSLSLELWVRGGMLIWLIFMSLLMVSNVRFRTFKDIDFRKHGPMVPLVGLVVILAVFASHPEATLFSLGMLYLGIGLIEGGVIVRRRESSLRDEQRRLRKQARLKRKLAKKQARLQAKQGKANRFPPGPNAG